MAARLAGLFQDSSGLHLVRFRSFELAKRLHGACPALPRQLFGSLLGAINRQIVCKDVRESEIVPGYWTWVNG